MNVSRRRAWPWIAAGIVAGALLHGVAGWWSPPVSAQTPHAIGGGGTTTFTTSTTFTEICVLPGGGTSTVDACATPGGCACPAGTSKVMTNFSSTVTTTTTFGPAPIFIGDCQSQPFVVLPGTQNINTNTESTTTFTCIAPPTIGKAFGAGSIPVNGTTTLTFTLTNPNGGTALTGVGFSDTLPSGLTVPNGTSAVCSGTLTTSDTNTITLVGATMAAGGSCVFPVTVTGTTAGTKNNTTGSVTSANGGTGNAASASLTVVAPPVISKAFGTTSLGLGGTTSLSFTITNPAGNAVALTGVSFTDTLPAGLVVATPNGLTGSCGGGTITASAGSNSISLAGATIAAGGSCTFSVNVTAVASG